MMDYLPESVAAIVASVGGWLIHKLRQKEQRIAQLELRLTTMEAKVDKDLAVMGVRFSEVGRDIREIKDTVRDLARRHMS